MAAPEGLEADSAVAAVQQFRELVTKVGLWKGAWVGTLAIRRHEDSGWVLFGMKVILAAPGVRIPTPEKAFDVTSEHVRFRTIRVDEPRLWALLEALARNQTSVLTELVGAAAQFPPTKNPARWRTQPVAVRRDDRVQFQLERDTETRFDEAFGTDAFAIVNSELSRRGPYAGLKELSENMYLRAGVMTTPETRPLFEVAAEIALGPFRASYDAGLGGIQLEFGTGANVPLERVSISATPDPRTIIAGRLLTATGDGEVRQVSHVIQCPPLKQEETLELHFDDHLIASTIVPSSQDAQRFAAIPGSDATSKSAKRFHAKGGGLPLTGGTATITKTTNATIQPIATADVPSAIDAFGFKPYVDALAGFLMNPKTRPPLTVAIEGEWGSGKSSFMLQLETALAEEWKRLAAKKEGSEKQPKMVKFNAWRFDKDDALWASFAMEFARQVTPWWPLSSVLRIGLGIVRIWRGSGRLALLKVLFAGALFGVGGWLASKTAWVNAWEAELKAVAAVLLAPLSIPFLSKLWGFFGNPFSVDLKKLEDAPSYEGRVPFLQQFHDDFGLVVNHYVGSNRRAFVFIDDLDRCEVPRAAELLQAINLMIPSESQLVFILGIDREKVAAGVAARNEKLLPLVAPASEGSSGKAPYDARRALEFGHSYVERFVQIPFQLPKLSLEQMEPFLDHLLGRHPSEAIEQTKPQSSTGAATTLPAHLVPAQAAAPILPSGSAPPPAPAVPVPPPPTPEELATQQTFLTNAESDSPHVRNVMRMVAPALSGNPRRLKRFLNLFRLSAYIAAKTGLLKKSSPAERPLTLEQLAKWVVLRMVWPRALEFFESPGEDDTLSWLSGFSDEVNVEPPESVGHFAGQFPGLEELLLYGTKGDSAYSLSSVNLRRLREVVGAVTEPVREAPPAAPALPPIAGPPVDEGPDAESQTPREPDKVPLK